MIGPKQPKLTAAQERRAYNTATERDGDRCQRCLRACGAPNRNHRIGRGRGGRTTPANLVILGGSGTTGCHGWATQNPKDAEDEGWSCPSWVDPTRWPIVRYYPTAYGTQRRGWALLDDAGGVTEITAAEAAALREGADR